MAKPAIKELTDGKISKVLSQGVLLTMEDDLRRMQAVESRELRFKKQRESAKIMPVSDAGDVAGRAPARAAPAPSQGFIRKIKRIFKKETEPVKKAEKPAVETKPAFVSKALQPVSQKVPSQAVLSAPAPIQDIGPIQKPALPAAQQPAPAAPVEAKKVQEPKLKHLLITKEEAGEIITKRKDLKKEVEEIENQLESFAPEKKPLETEIAELDKAKQAIQAILNPILEKEAKLEAEEKAIESQETKAASIQAKHKLEQKRWSVESQRRKVEHQKWVEEEKIEFKNNETTKIKDKLKVILAKEKDLKQKRQEILKKLEQADLFEKRAKFGESKRALEEQLSLLIRQEKEIEQKEGTLEQKEKQARTSQERRVVEKQRWELEIQRRKIEQKRWQVEKKNQELQEEVEVIIPLKDEKPPVAPPAAVSVEKEAEPAAPLKEEAVPLRRRGMEWRPVKHVATPGYEIEEEQGLQPKQAPRAPLKSAAEIPLEDMSEQELIERIRKMAEQEEKRKKIQTIKKSAQEQRMGPYVPKSKGPISKAQILQKLSTISPKEQASRENFLTRVAGKAQPIEAVFRGEDGDVIFRPVVRRSSVLQKIAARVMFLVLILGVLVLAALLLHTYVFSRKPSPQPPPAPPIEQPEPSEASPEPAGEGPIEPEPSMSHSEPAGEEPPAEPEPEPEPEPAPLIDVSETQTLWLSPIAPISELLSDALEDNKDKQGFVRVLFRDERTGDIQGFESFLNAFNVSAPTGFLEGLVMPATLFIYSSDGKVSFGFTAEVEDSSALIASLKSWEASMEGDTEGLFTALGKRAPAISKKFITAKHGSEGFRYQTFTKQDFGICYAVTYGNYFIFTTSYEAMQKTLDNLTNL